MSRKLQQAAAFAVAATMVFTISGAAGAIAQDQKLGEITGEEAAHEPLATEGAEQEQSVRFVSQEVVQPIPQEAQISQDIAALASDASSLGELVATIPAAGELSRDMHCLASAIYFEARGEQLLGQLAVGQVIINRAESDIFPSTYCDVIYQRSQFSFVRKGRIPAINTSSPAWSRAKAVARIAHEGLWDSPAREALFFHATYVNPGWRRTRVARVDSHIFYR